MPDRFYFLSAVVDFDRLELQAFGIGVDGVYNTAAARRQGTNVKVVRGRYGIPDQFFLMKYRYDKSHIWNMTGTTVGIIVHDHVPGMHLLAPFIQCL